MFVSRGASLSGLCCVRWEVSTNRKRYGEGEVGREKRSTKGRRKRKIFLKKMRKGREVFRVRNVRRDRKTNS